MCVLCFHAFPAEEEEFCRYYASLFAVPASGGSAEPEMTAPESFLTIEILNEVRRTEDLFLTKIVLFCFVFFYYKQ